MTSDSICSNDYHPKKLLDFNSKDDYAAVYCYEYPWICFDFKDMRIKISKYSIKSSKFSENTGHIKNWVIEISDDGKQWNEIDKHSNYSGLNGPNIIKTFNVIPNRFVRYCRFRHTGDFYTGNLEFNSIEFYGLLKMPKSLDK